MLNSVARQPYLFWLALLLAVLVSVYQRLQFDFNAGHIDEYDYLFVGKMLWSGQYWRSYIYIFGSDLNWYLLGLGERLLGGLTGARMVAAVCGVLSLAGVFWAVRVWSQSTALAGMTTGLISLQAIHIFLSRFATYDIISLAFFCLALAPLLLACRSPYWLRYCWLLLATALFVLSVTSKYITIVYLPLLSALALLLAPRIGLLFAIGSSLLIGGYIYWHWDDLLLLYEVQIRGVHGANASQLFILRMEWLYLGLPLLLWLSALCWCVFVYRRRFWRQPLVYWLLALLLLALPLAVYHLHSRNMIALYKHLVYAQLFLLPAAAWLLWQFMQRLRFNVYAQAIAATVVGGMLWLNLSHLQAMERAYPNVEPVFEALAGQLDQNSTILSEDPYLFRYLAFAQVPQRHIKESNWLDNNRDGKYETKDAVEALWDAKFSYVFLNDQLHPNKNRKLRKIMTLRNYEKLLSIPYDTPMIMSKQNRGHLELYRRTRKPGIPLSEDDMFR